MKTRNELKIGDRVRAWDHEEREGVRPMFIVGQIVELEDDMIVVDVEIDTVFPKNARTQIRTPLNMIFGDWDKRIEFAPTSKKILTARDGDKIVFWTGQAGQAWKSVFIGDALRVSDVEAARKVESFNEFSPLHGLTWSVSS